MYKFINGVDDIDFVNYYDNFDRIFFIIGECFYLGIKVVFIVLLLREVCMLLRIVKFLGLMILVFFEVLVC